ncbi:CDP-Glycerol:Poly(glycerophosphate) glycerophosphotransferase [Maribacter sedimenticola]|uniref:CDP-Glycerol:Poly(Glycerophosphate) glycerophosphotransferase n=1 Tax=Maribacter sedimenticola TaxID=228956 RepID=A0ABY1SCH2_9FLAO|nr:CDP-glycerol glycerophosphotransferase family protein [Maribacter sedimenticola]SNR24555.1 CDP-Glycerol:Poly(glycerophosphate) glycerophosphotransferase [Maribacter sedimenticola]
MKSNIIKLIVTIFVGAPIYFISIVFPKNQNLAVIGSSLGKHFSDNSKYFFIHHYSLSKPKIKLVWISKNKTVVKNLNEQGLPAKYLYTIQGVYTVLRASKAYISHQLADINGPLIGGAKIIQLWHAMALRKIGVGGDWYKVGVKGKLKDFASKWFPYSYYMKCDILYASCEISKINSIEPFSNSFRNKKIANNIYLARHPRTICFDKDFYMSKELFPEKKMLEKFKEKYSKVIAWLPTQRRRWDKTIIDVIKDSKLDLNAMDLLCKSKNYLFVIKAHFLDFDEVSKIAQEYDNIYVYQYADPYPLLKYSDALVTDYSSVFFDYLFLNKPIVFLPYDLELYSKEVDFYYDYENLKIGPIYKTWENVMEYLSLEEDFYSSTRNATFLSYNFVMNMPD